MNIETLVEIDAELAMDYYFKPGASSLEEAMKDDPIAVFRIQTIHDPSVGIFAVPLSPVFSSKSKLWQWWKDHGNTIMDLMEHEEWKKIDEFIKLFGDDINA